jgi:hypothetical protein
MTTRRWIAATELTLIFPAALFMTALFVRNLQPQQYEPAHTAQQIVMWYVRDGHGVRHPGDRGAARARGLITS